MATSTFASLMLPAPEDTMEMSSPAGAGFDDDIEIDFGDFSRTAQVTDDDQMIEDSDVRPLTATDAAMEYDLHAETVPVNEEEMSDDIVDVFPHMQGEDDELIDYDDDEDHAFQDQVEPTHIYEDSIPSVAPVVVDLVDIVDERENELEQQTMAHGHYPEVDSESGLNEKFPSTDSLGDNIQPASLDPGKQEVSQPDGVATSQSREVQEVSTSGRISGDLGDVADPETIEASSRYVTVDSNISAYVEGLDSPTDTGLHPVTLHFEEEEMPLFKSHAHQDGLLKDDNLVNVSLADMMDNCRQRLLVKRSKVIPDDHELFLNFEGLPMTFYELSHAAFEVSLSEILSVYVHLQRNDGLQDIPPLSLVLSSQLKVTSSLAILKQAANEGFGMPDIEQTSEHDDFNEGQEGEDDFIDELDNRAEEREKEQEHYGDGIPNEDGKEHVNHAEAEQNEPKYTNASDAKDPADVQNSGHKSNDLAECWTQVEEYEEVNTGGAVDYTEFKLKKTEAEATLSAQSGGEEPSSAGLTKTSDGEVEDDGLQYRVIVETSQGHPTILEPQVDNIAEATSTASSTTFEGDVDGEEAHNLVEPSYGDDRPSANVNASDTYDEHSQRVSLPSGFQLNGRRTSAFRAHSTPPTQESLEQYPALGSEDLLQDFDDDEEDAEGTKKDVDEEEHSAYTQDQADTFDDQQGNFQPSSREGQSPEAVQPLTDDLYNNNDEEHIAQDDEHELPDDTVVDGDRHSSSADEDEDHIDFDDDTTEQHEARKASQPNILHLDSPPQAGKRTFDEHVADDEIDFDEPELKRPRS